MTELTVSLPTNRDPGQLVRVLPPRTGYVVTIRHHDLRLAVVQPGDAPIDFVAFSVMVANRFFVIGWRIRRPQES